MSVDPRGIPLDQLVVGRRYTVHIEDCCVEALWSNQELLAVHEDDGLVFRDGEIGPVWGSWWVTEAGR